MSSDATAKVDVRISENVRLLVAKDHDHLLCADGHQLAWLIEQLIRWPERVDERFTTNDRFLRHSSASTMLTLADRHVALQSELTQAREDLERARGALVDVVQIADVLSGDVPLSIGSMAKLGSARATLSLLNTPAKDTGDAG